jgi:flagellar motility protein MotE (MotC chaperone)
MIKYALLGLMGLLSFVGTLIGLLALTGNLSWERLQQVANPVPARTAPASSAPDPVGPLAEALKQKEAQLRKLEQNLSAREARVEQREKELNRLRGDLEGLRAEISSAMDEADTDQEARRKTVADTLAAMRPENAARTLQGMSRDEVAAILNLVPARSRGKIMDAMREQEFATGVLQALQEQRL